ncbi:MAG: GNAT family N-acetyltransferase [Candidatus Lambdaproteobacteria bacterium RIFOXYD12_FULL_49_8]|uniref:GNAT family N-acetyltransferase n=1 Tax=Candidatus Lambdaproteobacteria bacterium RIFOXYD2_FULL_50_16 TaxID=1817772 RepID=A0A1F6G5L0_9PROT|nr:MAG: GNAT family N-acetyltransferase [Candidatus Lambdaproteobacteria bacterium RIFOXYD2_FULL_50_16]OGG97970.1 MAG: GNAT family N-acetyltransferase [Candidatus Lambdaproteobacteria bacterium RIFOXYD12_FULL_49_8]
MLPLIRPAQNKDLPVLIDLLAQLFSIEADFAVNPEKQRQGLDLMLQEPNACVLVAEINGQVVGMGSLQILISTAEGGPVGLIEDLLVLPAWRKEGLGRAILDALEAKAAAQGCTRLQLLADKNNLPALAFYQSQGWLRTDLVGLRKEKLCLKRLKHH